MVYSEYHQWKMLQVLWESGIRYKNMLKDYGDIIRSPINRTQIMDMANRVEQNIQSENTLYFKGGRKYFAGGRSIGEPLNDMLNAEK